MRIVATFSIRLKAARPQLKLKLKLKADISKIVAKGSKINGPKQISKKPMMKEFEESLYP